MKFNNYLYFKGSISPGQIHNMDWKIQIANSRYFLSVGMNTDAGVVQFDPILGGEGEHDLDSRLDGTGIDAPLSRARGTDRTLTEIFFDFADEPGRFGGKRAFICSNDYIDVG